MSDEVSVRPEQLLSVAAQLDQLRRENVHDTLSRFQELKRLIDAMAPSAPDMHGYATTYIQTMQRRYLAFTEQYQDGLIHGLHDVAQEYRSLHKEVVQEMEDM